MLIVIRVFFFFVLFCFLSINVGGLTIKIVSPEFANLIPKYDIIFCCQGVGVMSINYYVTC